VRDTLRVFADELGGGIVCSGMNAGSHEKTLEMWWLAGARRAGGC
jgi:hypothetical protein